MKLIPKYLNSGKPGYYKDRDINGNYVWVPIGSKGAESKGTISASPSQGTILKTTEEHLQRIDSTASQANKLKSKLSGVTVGVSRDRNGRSLVKLKKVLVKKDLSHQRRSNVLKGMTDTTRNDAVMLALKNAEIEELAREATQLMKIDTAEKERLAAEEFDRLFGVNSNIPQAFSNHEKAELMKQIVQNNNERNQDIAAARELGRRGYSTEEARNAIQMAKAEDQTKKLGDVAYNLVQAKNIIGGATHSNGDWMQGLNWAAGGNGTGSKYGDIAADFGQAIATGYAMDRLFNTGQGIVSVAKKAGEKASSSTVNALVEDTMGYDGSLGKFKIRFDVKHPLSFGNIVTSTLSNYKNGNYGKLGLDIYKNLL